MTRMTISDRGVALIKRFEGFRADGLELPDGQWLIGYGNTRMSQPDSVTPEQAHGELMLDLVAYEECINEKITISLTQAQFDALASFAFSIGLAAFERSDVVRRVNAGDFASAGAAMDAWRKSAVLGEKQVLDALVRRRVAERAMLLEDDDPKPIPSAFVRPQIDHAAAILGAPVAVGVMPELEAAIAAHGEQAASEAVHEASAIDVVADRIATILAREPETAMALAAKPQAFVEETTAAIDEVSAVPEAALVPVQSAPARPAAAPGRSVSFEADWIALAALLVFGVGLVTLGALSIIQAGGSGDGWLAGAVLGAPGLIAMGMALFHFVKSPQLEGKLARP